MSFTEKEIESLVKKYYQLDVTAKSLTGEYEFNFLLTTQLGTKYIFKAASDEQIYNFFDAQIKIVQHLSKTEVGDKFFQYIPNLSGELMTILQKDGRKFCLRLITF